MVEFEYLASANSAWIRLIKDVFNRGADTSPRGMRCKELLAYTSHVNMKLPVTTIRPKLGFKFLAAEAWWIISGKNDVASIKPYSPHIASFSNDGRYFDGAYGPRIVDQLRYVVDTLVEDPESRRAVIEIWRPNPRSSRDFPCTLTVQWMIRQHIDGIGRLHNYLHCFDTMRSSDSWLGWPYDVFNFSMLSAYIQLMLKHDRGLETELGFLHLTSASQHLYVDRQVNVPYSLEDVEAALYIDPATATSYAALNTDEFQSPEEFLDYMSKCKDMQGTGKEWLKEFQLKNVD